ncbi:myeloid-associated differentiation marker-like [Notolabrus celidotus]|uniref:myeloid-associated differentiation marker-like n=1 Tax=Notolabrus celidotus TaxID=1203425 RepID=UPI00148F6FAC|nr:myeloid-associated differentiation marker-like [Notolabrus celidotus]
MAVVDVRALTQPVGVMRVMASFLTCMCFSLVASVGYLNSPYWAWCMFTWCFCFFFTLLILVLEFTSISSKLPFAWEDFTTAFAMLASLMCLAASIIYPVFFTCKTCHRQMGASMVSWVCFAVYTGEVVLKVAKAGEISGFLSTVPGLLKVLEAFVACIIFTYLPSCSAYSSYPGLQWCVAVYSICFIFALLVIVLTIGRLLSLFPAPFDKVLSVCNVVAVLMYMTAVVVWPLYSFRNNPRPEFCSLLPFCPWDNLVVVTFMTCFNLVAYIVDTVYSFRLVFLVSRT